MGTTVSPHPFPNVKKDYGSSSQLLKESPQNFSQKISWHYYQILALLICYTCQDLMTVCYVFIWTEPLHLVTGYHQPIHSLAKIKSSNYSLTNQGCFGFFFFQKVLNSINSSLTRNGKGLISRIIVLLLQFAVFKFSCWLDWKFYDIAYETSLIQLWSCVAVLSCLGYIGLLCGIDCFL